MAIARTHAVVAGARTARGVSLVLVDLNQPGVTRTTLKTLDPTRGHAKLEFKGAKAERLGAAGQGWELAEAVLDRAAVLIAFEQVGGSQACLEMATDYAKRRYAFSRPIGSFQAIKHKLADMYVAIEVARSNAYYGAWALSTEAAELPFAAAASRAAASDAYYLCAKENIQTHGGMGFTWEVDCHLFYPPRQAARRASRRAGGVEGEAREAARTAQRGVRVRHRAQPSPRDFPMHSGLLIGADRSREGRRRFALAARHAARRTARGHVVDARYRRGACSRRSKAAACRHLFHPPQPRWPRVAHRQRRLRRRARRTRTRAGQGDVPAFARPRARERLSRHAVQHGGRRQSRRARGVESVRLRGRRRPASKRSIIRASATSTRTSCIGCCEGVASWISTTRPKKPSSAPKRARSWKRTCKPKSAESERLIRKLTPPSI